MAIEMSINPIKSSCITFGPLYDAECSEISTHNGHNGSLDPCEKSCQHKGIHRIVFIQAYRSFNRWPTSLRGNEPPKSAFIDPTTSSNVSGLETHHLRPSAGTSVAERNRKSPPSSGSAASPSFSLHRALRSNGHPAEVVGDIESSGKRTRTHGASGFRGTPSANEIWSSDELWKRPDQKTHQFDRSEREIASSTSRNTDEVNVAFSPDKSDVRANSSSHLPHSSPSVWRHREGDIDRGGGNANGSLENYSLSPLANLLTSLVATSTSGTNKWFQTGSSLPSTTNHLPISPSSPWLDPAPWYNLFPGGSTVAQRHLLQVAVAAAAATAAAKATWQPLLASDHVTSPQQHARDGPTRGGTSSVSSSSTPMIGLPPGPLMNGMAKRLFGCPQCRYLTDRKNNLKRHVTTMHQESAGKTLECCAVQFRSKAALRDHVTIFHGAGYTCRHCARNFCRKALLKRHLAVHSGQKDYICSRCDYATSHKSNLERHKKVHERAPYENVAGDPDEGGPESLGSADEECDFDDQVSVDTDVAAAGRHAATADFRRPAFPSESHSQASMTTRSAFDSIVSLSHHLMSRHFGVVRSDEVIASQSFERTSGCRDGRTTELTAMTAAAGNSASTIHALAEPTGASLSSFPINGWQHRHPHHQHHHQHQHRRQHANFDHRSRHQSGSSHRRDGFVRDSCGSPRSPAHIAGGERTEPFGGFATYSPGCATGNTQPALDVLFTKDIVEHDEDEEEEINVVDDLVN